MSVLMQLLGRNKPLHSWETFEEPIKTTSGSGFSWALEKNPEKTARSIFSQLSHEAVVRLVANEFEQLPAQVRLELRDMCNTGNASGNVRKNVQRLNALLDGKLLREGTHDKRTVNTRIENLDGAFYKQTSVNEAEAAAQRKYAAYVKDAPKKGKKK
jgi:hypothetical protein